MKRTLSTILALVMLLAMVPTMVFAAGHTWEEAEAKYDRVSSFDHVDIRVDGDLTITTKTDDTQTGVETKAVKVVYPVKVTVTHEDGTSMERTFNSAASYEWRWTGIRVVKTDKITVTGKLQVEGETATHDFSKTYQGRNDFIQAILDCDGFQGLDFNIKAEELIEIVSPKGELTISKTNVGAASSCVSFAVSGPDNYSAAVTLNADNNWTYKLDKLAYGRYTVTETTKNTPFGYNCTTTVNGVTTDNAVVTINDSNKAAAVNFTNTYSHVTTTFTVNKVWNDDNDRDNLRPDFVKVVLMNGANKAGEATLNAANQWSYTWDGLRKYDDNGGEIVYTVVETSNDNNYTASVEGSTITNTHKVDMVVVTMTKVWKDDDNRDGVRPESVDIQLYANGEAYGDIVTVEANNKGVWTYTWEGLYANENGEPIVYTVMEVNVDENYTASYSEDTLTITNTHEPETVSKTVTKIWDDDDNRDGVRPESVTVKLMNGTETVGTAELNDANQWTYTWKDLYANENGEPITYTVEEVNVAEGYEADVDGMTITNTHVPATTNIYVTKFWKGDTEADRPESITVNVLADGKVVESMELTAADNWAGSLLDMPAYANGKAIVYTVEEEAVEGYTAAYSTDANGGLIITNTLVPAPTVDPGSNVDPEPAPTPQTGDSSNMVLYIVLAVMAMAGVCAMVFVPKKHGKRSA